MTEKIQKEEKKKKKTEEQHTERLSSNRTLRPFLQSPAFSSLTCARIMQRSKP